MTYSLMPAAAMVSEGAGTLTFTISRSSSAAAEVLYLSTSPALGFANDGDYAGILNQALSFAAGQSSLTVTISLNDDSLAESAESFGLLLQQQASDPVETYLARSAFTILDNDQPPEQFTPVALTVYPGSGIRDIGQGNRDSDDSHQPDTARQWAYDFLAPGQTDVHAVAGGIVVAVRQDLTGAFRGYGNVVTILHDGGFYATYAHLSAFSASVAVGSTVAAGDIIASSGDSGSWDGTALHPNLHIQFGTAVSWLEARFGDGGTATLIADGSGDGVSPAYFPRLVIRFDQRADPGLSTDTDYFGTMGIDDFTGNALANAVEGRDGSDVIRGMSGDDTLLGGNGHDHLAGGIGHDLIRGGAGNDILRGGSGVDRLTGGSGADIFVFSRLGDTTVPSLDVVTDFRPGHDRIDASAIDAQSGTPGTNQAFDFIATGEFTAEGQIRAIQSGNSTMLLFNTTGEAGAEMKLFLLDTLASALQQHDFIL